MGLMVMAGFATLAISGLVFAGVVAHFARGQVDHGPRERMRERGPRNGEHRSQITQWRIVEDLSGHRWLRRIRGLRRF